MSGRRLGFIAWFGLFSTGLVAACLLLAMFVWENAVLAGCFGLLFGVRLISDIKEVFGRWDSP